MMQLKYLKEADLMEPVMERIMEKMEFYVNQRAQHQLELGVITFSNVFRHPWSDKERTRPGEKDWKR